MKKLILLTLSFIFTISLSAQLPKWVDSDFRASKYSDQVYLVAFTQDEKQADESILDLLERVKSIARADIAKNLLSKIESVSEIYIENSTTADGGGSFLQVFKTAAKVETNAEINGVKIDTYYDESSNWAYAFAYANKYEVIAYYKINITFTIQQIEGIIQVAKDLVAISEKAKAKKEYLKTAALFAKLQYAQGLLTALDKNADESSLQITKSIELQNEVIKAMAELEQGIFVFIQCNADLFGKKSLLLENKLKSELSKEGCSFTTEKEEADWSIEIDALAREYSNPAGSIFFTYIDATINLRKIYNNQHIYQDEISQKGGHTRGYTLAATEGYKELSSVIATNLLEYIKK